MAIQLSEHFTYRKLLRFTVPSIIMMIFTSIYGVVDGIFVSNFVGKTPFAALNLIMPVCMLLGAFGFMVGTGGSALVSNLLGEGKREEANRTFSMLIYLSAAVGILLTAAGILLMRPISAALGAEGQMLEDCVLYGRTLLLGSTAFILQNEFQSFLIAAEKPQLGLMITVAAGVTNIVLDALFVGLFRWGLAGAAMATVLSQVVGGVIPLIYFIRNRHGVLFLSSTAFDGRALLQTCVNGSSEMMTNLSLSLVNILYNFQLMRFAGENGVAAYGVVMYVNFIFISAYLGYSIGVAPVVSFHFGARNGAEVRNLLGKSLKLLSVGAVTMAVLGGLLAGPLSAIFVGYDADLFAMTSRGLKLYSISYLLTGYNIFASAFFTALNDGVTSAVISFLRTLLFQVAAVLLLPLVLELDGIWLAIVAAEGLALLVSGGLLVTMRKKYGY
jgi:putative MATE family efflux protein